MSLRDQLLAIYEERGRIDPDTVVDAARPEDHPLHDRFTWDDSIAGPLWRREEARQLLKSVKVTYKPSPDSDDTTDVRAFYAVPVGRGEYEWSSLEEVIDDPVSYKLVLQEMQREIRAMRDRYSHLKEYREALALELEAIAA